MNREGGPWGGRTRGSWLEGTASEPLPEVVSGPFLPPPASSSSSDELSWIIELLEKDGMAFQEGLGDSGPFGENPFSFCSFSSLSRPICNPSNVLDIYTLSQLEKKPSIASSPSPWGGLTCPCWSPGPL